MFGLMRRWNSKQIESGRIVKGNGGGHSTVEKAGDFKVLLQGCDLGGPFGVSRMEHEDGVLDGARFVVRIFVWRRAWR